MNIQFKSTRQYMFLVVLDIYFAILKKYLNHQSNRGASGIFS